MRKRQAGYLALACLAGGIYARSPGGDEPAFEHAIVDADGPRDIWLKAAGDLNGDGRPDLIAGGHRSGGLVWYENPGWKKRVIAAAGAFSTDGEVADVDGDGGDNDVVVITARQLLWYQNPDWTAHHIDDVVLHDIEAGDLDGDGRPDIVGRDQGAFGGHKGDTLHIYYQNASGGWAHRTVSIPDGEGLLLADINRDGHPDAVVGRFWLENPGRAAAEWTMHEYGRGWDYPHVFVAAGDINGDGRTDIVLAPSERAGGTYRISWFEAPRNPGTGTWKEHVVDDPVETVHHFVGVADFNRDGRPDIATARMHQAKSREVSVYVNAAKGRKWTKRVVSPGSSHSMRIVDVDGDGWPDLFGADWEGHAVELWRNAGRRILAK